MPSCTALTSEWHGCCLCFGNMDAALLEWMVDALAQEAIESGEPEALKAWAEACGTVDDEELGVGD
jgi:hypothetical protein